jgi:hypothetical protein
VITVVAISTLHQYHGINVGWKNIGNQCDVRYFSFLPTIRAKSNVLLAGTPHTAASLGARLRDTPLQIYNWKRSEVETANPQQFDFYPSFYLLSQCDVLLVPNSTFSHREDKQWFQSEY